MVLVRPAINGEVGSCGAVVFRLCCRIPQGLPEMLVMRRPTEQLDFRESNSAFVFYVLVLSIKFPLKRRFHCSIKRFE